MEKITITELVFDEALIQETLNANPDMFSNYDTDGLGFTDAEKALMKTEDQEGAKDE